MSEEQIKDMILKQCLELTTNNDFRPPISAYDGVDIDDVVRTCKQLQDKKTYLDLIKENQSLKKHLEDANEKIILLQASEPMLEWKKELDENQQKDFISYLENEKDRLARECSQIYNDSLGKTRLVNEDIFDEVNDILQKYKSITGDDK